MGCFLAAAPLYAMISDRFMLIRRLKQLREYTMTHRYYEDRRSWRGLREDRDAVMDRILSQNDDWLRRIVGSFILKSVQAFRLH
jgi:hypothetical protein